MEFYMNYLENLAETPREKYENMVQETINKNWDNTTQLRMVKEEHYPFDGKYEEYEAWVNTVSDVSINTQKVIGDYIDIQFKDCKHPLNHRGQKYLYAPNEDENEQIYLCYDKMQPLGHTADFKAIRCNNYIKWLDEEGKIQKEPMFIGYELSSTNNQITKKGTVSQRRLVCMIQGNENTYKITQNQRFMLGHKRCFKITEINDMVMDDINSDNVDLLTFYVEWTPMLPSDNKEENICDFYTNKYELKIDQDDIEQLNGYKGQLTYTVKLNGVPTNDVEIKWVSTDKKVLKIDQDGNYELVGNANDTCKVECYIVENEEVKDSIEVKIVDMYLGIKTIQVSPIISELEELSSQDFKCAVYMNGVEQIDTVDCVGDWEDYHYTLERTLDGFRLTNNSMCKKPLKLTFTSGTCDPIEMTVKLKSLL